MTANVGKALKGLIDPGELSEAEQEDYFDKIGAVYRMSNPKEDAFFAERRRLGVGVGMDDAGNIVHQKPEASNS